MDTYFTENDLLYLRGWTAKAITTLLGAPDIANKGKVANCYLVKRVKAGEQTEVYRQAKREVILKKFDIEPGGDDPVIERIVDGAGGGI